MHVTNHCRRKSVIAQPLGCIRRHDGEFARPFYFYCNRFNDYSTA